MSTHAISRSTHAQQQDMLHTYIPWYPGNYYKKTSLYKKNQNYKIKKHKNNNFFINLSSSYLLLSLVGPATFSTKGSFTDGGGDISRVLVVTLL